MQLSTEGRTTRRSEATTALPVSCRSPGVSAADPPISEVLFANRWATLGIPSLPSTLNRPSWRRSLIILSPPAFPLSPLDSLPEMIRSGGLDFDDISLTRSGNNNN